MVLLIFISIVIVALSTIATVFTAFAMCSQQQIENRKTSISVGYIPLHFLIKKGFDTEGDKKEVI